MTAAYQDDSDVTEITIQPDGRLYVFGLSEKVRDLLRLLEEGKLSEAGIHLSVSEPVASQSRITLGENA